MNAFFKVLCILLIIFCSLSFSLAQPARILDDSIYIVYVPSNIDSNKKYPLVVALSPGADAKSMVDFWKNISEKYKWIILASKEFKNGIDSAPIFLRLVNILEYLYSQLPIDKSKIIATGLSGGGMGSHHFAFLYPDLISAVVINTGMMNEYFLDKKGLYPREKIAVFLASPTDFRYRQMKRDQIFLEGLGWKTKWIEFKGGHTMAPYSSYEEAAQWLTGQLDKN